MDDRLRYVVVWETSRSRFEEDVNARIAEGYSPQGGLAIVCDRGDAETFYQAMYLPEPESPRTEKGGV